MASITNSIELKGAIAMLEVEQLIKGQELREQFHITVESLKPVNFIENTIREVSSSPFIGKSLLGTAFGMAAGFLTKKVSVGKSGNVFRNLMGMFLEHGITNLIAQHPETIKKFGAFLFEKIQNKRESMDEEKD